MLSAGFKFICCSTEDDADNPKILWHENLLSMENIQVRQEEINNQVTLTFVAAYNEHHTETPLHGHNKNKSHDYIPKSQLGNYKSHSLVSSLKNLSRVSGMSVKEMLEYV